MAESKDDLLDDIRALVDDIESPFAYGGKCSIDGTLAIKVQKGPRIELARQGRPVQKKSFDSLLALMEPAPFGQGKKTRIDRTVRDALQIKAAVRPFEILGFDPRASGVLEEVRALLMPNESTALEAELYAMNAYGPGGHFAPHKDTPRGETMVGTLVVCLPSPFEGGELRLERGEDVELFDWSNDIRSEPGMLHYAAFFGDVDHRIATVSMGWRVTLSYVLRIADKKKALKAKAPAPGEIDRVAALTKLFSSAAKNGGFRDEGATLRFVCLHQYAATGSGSGRQSITEESARALKGRDGDVARAALAAGLPAALVHCLAAIGDGDELLNVRLASPPTRKELARIQSRIASSEADSLEEDDGDHFPVYTIGSWDRSIRVGEGSYSASGYYGNEASEAEFYVSSVLDVTLSPLRSRGGERVKHAKFGNGVVLRKVTQGAEPALQIRFENGDERTILERFVQLIG